MKDSLLTLLSSGHGTIEHLIGTLPFIIIGIICATVSALYKGSMEKYQHRKNIKLAEGVKTVPYNSLEEVCVGDKVLYSKTQDVMEVIDVSYYLKEVQCRSLHKHNKGKKALCPYTDIAKIVE